MEWKNAYWISGIVQIIAIMAGLLCFVCYRKKVQKEKKIYDSLAQKEDKSYALLEKIQNKLNSIEVKEENYEELITQTDSMLPMEITDIPILNALLWNKEEICKQEGIRLELQLKNQFPKHIELMDMIGLISNLLDNAIEAAKQTEEKWVCIKTNQKGNMLTVAVQNSKVQENHPLKRNMTTSKKDKKNHGYGTKIIKEIIEKYDGNIQYYDEGEVFEVFCLISVQEK